MPSQRRDKGGFCCFKYGGKKGLPGNVAWRSLTIVPSEPQQWAGLTHSGDSVFVTLMEKKVTFI
jgi:hypothetical protein